MGCGSICAWSFCGILLSGVVGIPLFFAFYHGGSKDPVFTVESAEIKAYNLTSENRLFCIFDFSIRAHNRNHKHSVTYKELDLEVLKGKHHRLADDVVIPFSQAAESDTVVAVEAVGLYVQLEDKIAGEMRADLAVGSTTVNVFFSGSLGDGNNVDIECRNVKVDFVGGEFVKVGCNVNVYDPNDN